MNPHLLEAARETPLFEGLSSDRRARAASAFCLRLYERGETISGSADTNPYVYTIASGVARSIRINQDGRCLTSGLLAAGAVFGRLPYLESDTTEQVEALVDTLVFRASTADLESLAAVDPIVARNLARSNAERLRDVETRLIALAFHPVPVRVAGVLIELADHFGKVTTQGVRLDIQMTHGSLAELSITTRETVTKIAGWLRNEEIASIERRLIWINNWNALEDVHAGRYCMPGRAGKAGMPA